MPELPDIEAYVEALRSRILGETLAGVRLVSAFVVRTVDPPLGSLVGSRVVDVFRLGKRIVVEFGPPARAADGETRSCFLVLHLMVAGRLRWKPAGAPVPRGSGLVALDFPGGTLTLTEAGKKRRASIHLVLSREDVARLDPGGLEVLGSAPDEFARALRRENHTLKRALTDPRIISGIGNAYSDEILHRARLSPFKQTQALGDGDIGRLHGAAAAVLGEWTARLRAEALDSFPEKVTAFRPDMAVHGRFGAACPACGDRIQRIVHSENECDYCPTCQTEGRILADRSLSRLLKEDWPRWAREQEPS